MNTRVAVAFAVLALSSSAVGTSAKADWGFLAGLEHVFAAGKEVILEKATHLAGAQRTAWMVLSQAIGKMASTSIATFKAAGVVPGIDMVGYFRTTSNAFLVGAIGHGLGFGTGLIRWMEQKTEDYARRMQGLVSALGAPATLVTSIRNYAQKVFGQIKGIAAGTIKATAQTSSAIVSDFAHFFQPLITGMVRIGLAAPARAKKAFDHFFAGFVRSLI